MFRNGSRYWPAQYDRKRFRASQRSGLFYLRLKMAAKDFIRSQRKWGRERGRLFKRGQDKVV
jgi:hypothetical protein